MAYVRQLATVIAFICFALTTIVPISNTLADIPAVKWTKVAIPDQGDAGRWLLASGSDVTHLSVASDGTIYAAANPTATNQRLFRSTDNGTTWSPTGQVTGTIIDIATVADDSRLVYYATSSSVYKSVNGGATFAPLPPNPGGSGANNVTITSVAITGPPNSRVVAVATSDTDPGQYGGVYTLEENQFFSTWLNTGIGNYDVLAIAAPPNGVAIKHLVAAASSETGAVVTARIGPAPWGSVFSPVIVSNVPASGAVLSFPDDYGLDQPSSTLFLGLKTNTGNGDVYRIDMQMGATSACLDLNAAAAVGLSNVDIGALTSSGNTTAALLVAGAAGSPSILLSADSGITWKKSSKGPTGTLVSALQFAPGPSASRRLIAATCGAESAFSASDDGGISWYQTGLIDTQITSSGILDLAVSANCSSGGSLFLLTWGGKHSVWRSRDSGVSWQRVFCSGLPGVDTINALLISPDYGITDRTLFVSGRSGSTPALWVSSDGGDTFAQRYAQYATDAWAAADRDTLLMASYDGSNGLILKSENGGFLFSPPVKVAIQPLKSLAVSPDFDRDQTVMAGSTVGKVYVSTDNATTFRQLGQTLPLSSTGAGQVCVAFDPDFPESRRVFAATDAPSTASSRERIFTLMLGESEIWESVDSTFPVGGIANRLALSQDGVLYVANMKAVTTITQQGGVERSLDVSSTDRTFETVTRGLGDGSTLRGLWISGNRLWTLDTTNTRLMTFIDTLSGPPALILPEEGRGGVDIAGPRLDWESLNGATTYEWQLNDADDFSDLQTGFENTTQGSSSRAPALQLATEYYWRVRVTGPIRSPWSAKGSFITKLGNTAIAPRLLYPEPGATGIPADPVFQWTSFAEAEAYELLLSTDATFAEPTVSKMGGEALPETAWQSNAKLEYGTTYYWKIRATGAGSFSDWSDVGGFIVQPAPTSPPSFMSQLQSEDEHIIQVNVPTPTVTSIVAPPNSSPPVWLLYVLGAVGVMLIGLLSTLLVILIRRR